MCVGTTESDQAKNMGKCVVCQWRAESKWHGWSVRQGRGGGGDSHTRLLHEIQNLLHELWKLAHNLLSQIVIISAEIGKLLLKMGKFLDFWKLLLETRVGWTTEPQAVPVAEPVFLRGTPRLPPFSGKHFSRFTATPSSPGATVPTFLPFWQQPLQLEVAVVGRGERDFSVKLSLSIAFATSVERYVFT